MVVQVMRREQEDKRYTQQYTEFKRNRNNYQASEYECNMRSSEGYIGFATEQHSEMASDLNAK